MRTLHPNEHSPQELKFGVKNTRRLPARAHEPKFEDGPPKSCLSSEILSGHSTRELQFEPKHKDTPCESATDKNEKEQQR